MHEENSIGNDISVIIPTLNGGMFLKEAVVSCLDEGIFPEKIIVIDNSSFDGSIDVIEKDFKGIIVIRNSCNRGFSSAVNQGLKLCDGELIIILNNDAKLCSGYLNALRQCVESYPDAVIFGARLLSTSGAYQNSVAAFPSVWRELAPGIGKVFGLMHLQEGKMLAADKPVRVPTVIGAAMAVRQGYLGKLGFLDEDFFFYLEETEWCYRAWKNGFSVVFCPNMRVLHALGKTANKYRSESRIEYHRSRLIYAKKVEGFGVYLILLVWLPARTLVNLLFNLFMYLLSFGLSERRGGRVIMYGLVFVWHITGRPTSWGIPNKCIRNKKDKN